MKSGTCPKCSSNEILSEESGWGRDVLPGGNMFNPIRLINYACGSCGYLETYVVPDDIDLLNQKWAKYVPKASS